MEKQIITKYLNRFITIEDGKFLDSGQNIYGLTIVQKLEALFSISKEKCTLELKEWALSKSMLPQDIETSWDSTEKTKNLTPITYEPKRPNRFVVKFPESFNLEEWFLRSASRPSMYVKNDTVKWKPIKIKFLDPIGPSATQRLFNLINEYSIFELFTFTIEMLDPTGVSIERWVLTNSKIKSIDFGRLDYSNDSLMECIMVVELGQVDLIY